MSFFFFRKCFGDIKNVYSVSEGNDKGHIEWKVDLEGSGLVVDSITIILSIYAHQTGRVMAMICGDNSCLLVGELLWAVLRVFVVCSLASFD